MRGKLESLIAAVTTALFVSLGCGKVADLGHNAHAGGTGPQSDGSGGDGLNRGGDTSGGYGADLGGANQGGSSGNPGSGGGSSGGDFAGGGSGGEPITVPEPIGWSLRDTTPYPRTGPLSVIDEDADRMIVFGGSGGNDIWELPLSGPREGQWSPIVASGDAPFIFGGVITSDSAIYDPFGKRMIVAVQGGGRGDSLTPLWALSLSGPPVWRRLNSSELPSDATFGQLALDRAGKRVLGVESVASDGSITMWALSLEGEPRWRRLLTDSTGAGERQVFDAKRRQLVVLGGSGWDGEVLAFSLDTMTWSQLLDWAAPVPKVVWPLVLDAAHDRIVITGDDGTLWFFSLLTNKLTQGHPIRDMGAYGSAVADDKRGRILYFGGRSTKTFDNEVRALALDYLTMSTFVLATRDFPLPGLGNAFRAPYQIQNAVWDPVRERVVALYNDEQGEGATFEHGLLPGDEWTPRTFGAIPTVPRSATYDAATRATLVFSSETDCCGSSDVFRLPSAPNATWETVDADPNGTPSPTSPTAGIYDSTARRLLLFGGYDLSTALQTNDTWAFSLEPNAAWTQIETTGERPSPRNGSSAVYDPLDHRMILYGGDGNDDLFSLALDQAPFVWTKLEASGASPGTAQPSGASSAPAAVYDPASRRMIVFNTDVGHDEVYALEIGPNLSWHRFCGGPISPTFYGAAVWPVLTPEGIFASSGGGAFVFDIHTPYCD